MKLNDVYQDRGIQKYSGFFLSEHTAELNKDITKNNKVVLGKEKMTEELIFEVIDFSIYKNTQVAIQLDIKDANGNFFEDISGHIEGYDEECIYLNEIGVPLNQIRHIVTKEASSWRTNS